MRSGCCTRECGRYCRRGFEMATDFHTHRRRSRVRALTAWNYDEITDADPVVYPASLGMHPWKITDKSVIPSDFPDKIRIFDALGEVGLDRCRGAALPVQEKLLRRLLRIAADAGKPAVIHCVRAYGELFGIAGEFPDLRFMLHGFRGSAELFRQLTERGFTVSLSRFALENDGLLRYIAENRPDNFGFESDDSETDVRELLAAAADKLHWNAAALEQLTDAAFDRFLYGETR